MIGLGRRNKKKFPKKRIIRPKAKKVKTRDIFS